MNDGPTIFAVFESKQTWARENPSLAKTSGYDRFLDDEASIGALIDDLRSTGILVRTWEYSSPTLGALLDELKAAVRPLLWNLTDGYDYFAGSNLPAFVRLARLPHFGSGSYTQMLCQNKHHLKAVAHAAGIPVARGAHFSSDSKIEPRLPVELTPPYFVKPSRLDNSIGDNLVTPICRDAESALGAVAQLMRAGIADVLVEEYLAGPEFSVAAANGGTWIAECVRVLHEGPGYFSGAVKDAHAYRCQVERDSVGTEIVNHAMHLARAIKLHDYFRADFRCDASGRPRLLEVNSSPFLASEAFAQLATLHFGSRAVMFASLIRQSYLRQASSLSTGPGAAH